VIALGAAVVVLHGAVAEAQDAFAVDRYRAAETPEDGFAISRPDDLGHLRFGAQLHLDYAYNPLVWEDEQGDPDSQNDDLTPVAHMLVANIGAAAGFWHRLVVFLDLPINLLMSGDSLAGALSGFSADGTSVGDLSLGARVRIWGDNDRIFGLGFQGTLTFPTAEWADGGQHYAGDPNFSGHLEALAEVRPGPVRITFNLGVRLREGSDITAIGYESSHELTYGLGLTYRPIDLLDIVVEGYGAANFSEISDALGNPFEAIGGLRFNLPHGLELGLAGGAGLVRGAGSPAARAVLTFGWRMLEPEPVVPEPEPQCPDPDADDICGDADQCPDQPEDVDQFEDANGCPDPDNDQDGILDGDDQCPNDPEDRDQFEDENGCPDPDNDGDGVLDAVDGEDGSCRDDPEDVDQFEDEDGCPDPDNDGDNVLDVDDRCPLIPGVPENQGCPPQVQEGRIVVLDRIQFATDSDRLLPTAIPILQAVAEVLRDNPEIHHVRVEGHTDSRHSDEYNMDLSRRRMERVVQWLTSTGGVEASRLTPHACGESNPIASNETNEGRLENRRVEFHITDPAPPGGGTPPCSSPALYPEGRPSR
jgi:outer membrane protein OmpA-like peptidoglycan-associated protein